MTGSGDAVREAVPLGFDLSGPGLSPGSLLRLVWSRRRLIALLARKDFFVRYRRASFGIIWAAALPALQAVVLSVIGTYALHIKTPGVSYPLFVFAGLVGYSYFTTTLTAASTAIVDNSNLASKIYFPRAVLVLSAVFANAYTAVINLALLLVLALIVGAAFGPQTLFLLPAFALVMLLAGSASLLFAGLHVYFRDIRFFITALLTVLLYVTPVFYSEQRAPHLLRVLLLVNPLTGVVELFRAAMGGADPGWPLAPLLTLIWVVVLGTTGVIVHCRRDRNFADLL